VQEQLDTPSPYYEGFTTNNKGKVDGLKKEEGPYIFARYIFCLNMYGL
jgi:hypothetical protein